MAASKIDLKLSPHEIILSNSKWEDILNPLEKIKYSMALALLLLREFPEDKSNKNDIRLGGPRKESLYIWTALVIVTKENPKHGIDASRIKDMWDSKFFDSEIGGWFSWSGFSKTSLYEREFKKYVTKAMCYESTYLKQFDYLNHAEFNNAKDKLKFVIQKFSELVHRRLEASDILNEAKILLEAECNGSVLFQDESEKNKRLEALVESVKIKRIKAVELEQARKFEEAKKLEEAKQLQLEEQEKKQQEANEQKRIRDEHLKNEQLKSKIKYASEKLLSEAAKFDATTSRISELLAEGADINYQDEKNKFTALMCALDAQNERIAEYLINLGADTELRNAYNKCAVDIVSRNSAIYRLLVPEDSTQIASASSSTVTPTASSVVKSSPNIELLNEINNDNLEDIIKFKRLLKEGTSIDYQDEEGCSLLMHAVNKKKSDIAEFLLNKGASPLLRNKDDEIASELVSRGSLLYSILKGYELIHAAKDGQLSQVKFLLKDLSLLNFQGLGGYTPLLIAIRESHVEVVAFLLQHAPDLDVVTKDGKDAFKLATNSAIVDLLEKAVNLDEPQNIEDIDAPKSRGNTFFS